MIDIPGFQIEEKIYDSVRSVVYRAKQTAGDRPVIIKTLKEEYPIPQEILRYRREYETTRRLKVEGIAHPIDLDVCIIQIKPYVESHPLRSIKISGHQQR